jgi:hypothetical protein
MTDALTILGATAAVTAIAAWMTHAVRLAEQARQPVEQEPRPERTAAEIAARFAPADGVPATQPPPVVDLETAQAAHARALALYQRANAKSKPVAWARLNAAMNALLRAEEGVTQ